eukprot:m.136032 g.136032  ORF g.136032 m.136032 type:complete len:80 (+) comp13987_c0_seq11:2263-2502(+)
MSALRCKADKCWNRSAEMRWAQSNRVTVIQTEEKIDGESARKVHQTVANKQLTGSMMILDCFGWVLQVHPTKPPSKPAR